MAGTSHKFQYAKLTAESWLDAAELLALADEVRAGITAVLVTGKREPWVHLGKQSAQGREYWVGRQRANKKNRTNLRFMVDVEPSTDGLTSLSTGITFFRTTQQMFLGFIPSGPKQLIDYGHYKRSMINLGDALKDRDPEAAVTISERAA